MTDARFPERWLNDRRIMRLPAEVFRGWWLATVWTVANRTEGRIEDGDVDLIPGLTPGMLEHLEEVGLVTRDGHGWHLWDWDGVQSSREQLEALERKKRGDRLRQRRKREREREREREAEASRDGSRDVTRDVHATDSGQDRPGQARTGEDKSAQNEVVSGQWPEVRRPGSPSRAEAVADAVEECPECGSEDCAGECLDVIR